MQNISIETGKGNNYSLQINESIICVSDKERVIRDIVLREDLSIYTLKSESKSINLSDIFQLDIKITSVGIVSIFFDKDNFDKEKVIEKISPLKDIQITDDESKKIKVNKLYEILNEENVLFTMFVNVKEGSFKIENLPQTKAPIIFVNKTFRKDKEFKSEFATALWKTKLQLIFGFIACLIIGFSTSIAVYNCYSGNAVFVFFFLFALASATLIGFIYRDILKKYKLVSYAGITEMLIDLIGIGAGLGIYAGYYTVLKDIPETVPGITPIALYAMLVSIILVILAVATIFIIKRFNKK